MDPGVADETKMLLLVSVKRGLGEYVLLKLARVGPLSSGLVHKEDTVVCSRLLVLFQEAVPVPRYFDREPLELKETKKSS